MVLIFFAFLAGLVTILSPCILPILPIVLSGSLLTGKLRPLGVIVGFIASFTFFATFSFALAKAFGFSSEVLRNVSVVLLLLFGLMTFIPQLQLMLENITSRFSSIGQGKKRTGFFGGLVLGVSLGLIWTPCVGPILASVLTLAATSQITFQLILITFSYSLGTALPLFFIAYGGKRALSSLPVLKKNAATIQKVFGILIILTALLIYFNIDRTFQTYVLDKFPQYGQGLTKLEDNKRVQDELEKLKNNEISDSESAPNQEFIGASKWLNSDPLTLQQLQGKVVLIDFWTYTCINCIRTLPYVTSWYEKYKNNGFVIIGVHTPEFEFEKNEKNVLDAMKKYNITYPVVQDNDFAIWESYHNQYWPAHYLIDKNGNIRYTHFGEGEYDTTEKMIQKLLREAGATAEADLVDVEPNLPNYARTPETYLGYGRLESLASPEKLRTDAKSDYTVPAVLYPDDFAYGGMWTIGEEYAESTKGSVLELSFKAKEVYLVMRPKKTSGSARAQIFIDGKLATPENSGEDVKDGVVTVNEDRLFTLVKFNSVHERARLRIHFMDEPIEVFAFTFG